MSQGTQITSGLTGQMINTNRSTQRGQNKVADILETIIWNVVSSLKNLLLITFNWTFFPHGPINNKPELVQIMAWSGSSDKPLSDEPMMAYFTKTYMPHSIVWEGNPPVTGGFPSQRASYVKNVSMPWLYYALNQTSFPCCQWVDI